ncbi:cupin domain-containing protein [Candidatus Fermentibacterales bacterium]|nr:cupin domain-containing protein [Candidatus Fermentibacterales bacterium]
MVTVKKSTEVRPQEVRDSGASKVQKRILVGEKEGSNRIVMRMFTIRPGGHTPRHTHEMEHVIYVVEGEGEVVDGDGFAHELRPGYCAFVPPYDLHHFQNRTERNFSFLCIIGT